MLDSVSLGKTLLLLELCLYFCRSDDGKLSCLGEVCMGRGPFNLGRLAMQSSAREGNESRPDWIADQSLHSNISSKLSSSGDAVELHPDMFYGSNATAGCAPDLTPMMSPANSETLNPYIVESAALSDSADAVRVLPRSLRDSGLLYPFRSCTPSLKSTRFIIDREPLGRLFHMKLPQFLKRR